MKRLRVILACAGSMLAAAATALLGQDPFLKDAQMSDRMMLQITDQMQGIADDMEASNVFNPDDILKNRALREKVDGTRRSELRKVVESLRKSEEDRANTKNHYKDAYEGHKTIVNALTAIAGESKADSEASMAYDLLQKLMRLAEAMADLVEKEADKAKMTAAELDRYSELAERARGIAEEITEAQVKSLVHGASKDLTGMTATQAHAKILKAIDLLKKLIEDNQNKMTKLDATMGELEKLLAKLDQNVKDIQAIQQKKDATKALDSIMAMDQTQRDLDKVPLPQAAAEVRQAQKDLGENKLPEALNDVKKAYNEVAQQLRSLADQKKALQQKNQDLLAAMDKLQNRMDQIQDFQNQTNEQMEKQAADQADGEWTEQEQKSEAGEMQELADDMKKQGLADAAEDMEKAGQQTQQNQPEQAQNSMQEAQQNLDKAMQQASSQMQDLQQSMAQMQQDPKQPVNLYAMSKGSAKKSLQRTGEYQEELVARGSQKGWRERLPPSERQALLSARKEKSMPEMDEAVKQYYLNLAK